MVDAERRGAVAQLCGRVESALVGEMAAEICGEVVCVMGERVRIDGARVGRCPGVEAEVVEHVGMVEGELRGGVLGRVEGRVLFFVGGC